MEDSDSTDIICQILYFMREGYYNNVLKTINNAPRTPSYESVYRYYNSIALLLQDRTIEAIKDLDTLKNKEDVGLGAMIALVYAHKKFASVDKDTVNELDSRIKEMRKKVEEKPLYYAGYFWYIVNRHDKAKEYIDRAIKKNPDFVDNICVRGWIEVLVDPKKAILFFQKSTELNARFTDAMFGISKCKELTNHFGQALDEINRILIKQPQYICGVIEKMKLQLCSQDWDQCNEVSLRALSIDSQCLEAFRYQILELLCRDGRYNEASEAISNLFRYIEKNEPYSHALFYDYSKVFARVCGRSAVVLKETEKYMEKAITLDKTNPTYLLELGSQKLAQEKVKEASKCYLGVFKIDETNLSAMIGKLKCQIMEEKLEEVTRQVELLTETQPEINTNPEFPFLKAILNKKLNKTEKNIHLIDEAITCHFKALKGLPLGKTYFYNLNPDFVLELVKEYMAFAPSKPLEEGQTQNSVLRKCSAILEPLTKAVPGLIDGIYYLAKVKYIQGDNDVAKLNLQKILDKDPSYSDAHILMAHINLKNNDFKAANQSLEYGLSYNFQIKNHPTYHLIKARIYKQQGNYPEALKTLQAAMQLPGVKKAAKNANDISIQDRASVYMELADVFLLNKLQHEATKIVQDALNEFKGTTEESRISVANVDLLLARGDSDSALAILKRIEPSQPYYSDAREKMASIYLKYRKDKRLYIATYKELADKFQTPHSLILLGDAYMNIIEPDKAVEAYEVALVKNPKDAALARKIGQALIKSHHYNKAISYYEAALKSGHQNLLRYDLAELYAKLSQFDSAERIISQALSDQKSDHEYLAMCSKCFMLLFDIHQKRNREESLGGFLEKAKDYQMKAIKKAQIESPENLDDYRRNLSKILKKFYEYFYSIKDMDSAEKSLKEAILQDSSDSEAHILLANHYLKTENLEQCSQLCNHMIKSISDPNEEILVTMANLSFRKGDIQQGIYQFKRLFEKRPDQYDALSTLIKFLHRAGKIDEAQPFFDRIERDLPKALNDAGYNYAKALMFQLSSKPMEAIKFYNKCRGDKKYGRIATIEMVNICLNPENDIRTDEDWRKKNINQKYDQSKVAQETASKLLHSINDSGSDLKQKIAENYCNMHSNEKNAVEKALESFIQLNSTYKDNPSVIRGIAECYMILKQPPKARNYLKQTTVLVWNSEDADDLEKCWLLLAHSQMLNGKFDQALELCRKCLDHNKSCTKAYEFIGTIMERESAYKDAADHYQKAWIYGNKNQPSIGFKLAFNYLKDKRYTDAVDICHNVIEKFPEFPKIRKEILEKARQSIRT